MTPKRRAAIAKRKIASAEKMIDEVGKLYEDIDNSIYEEASLSDFYCGRMDILRGMIDYAEQPDDGGSLL